MMEDPNVILFHIRHYQRLLERDHTPEARQLVTMLLTQAETELPLAEAQASGAKR